MRRIINSIWPRPYIGVFHGTNTWADWRTVLAWQMTGRLEPKVAAAFEHEFARVVGAREAFGFATGRMGLYAILDALDIGPGDEVVIPAFTCVVVPNAILYRGATPVYVDIDLRTFNIDPAGVEAAITPRTKALYAQHTFGLVCDIDTLRRIGRRHGLPIIEDAAHALGASWEGQPVGSLTEAAFFSTDGSKIINTKTGGVVTSSDAGLSRRLNEIARQTPQLSGKQVRGLMSSFLVEFPLCARPIGWQGRLFRAALSRSGMFFGFSDEMATARPTSYAFPARLPAIHAQLGRMQLMRLEANLRQRRKTGLALEQRLQWLGASLQPEATNHSFLRYSFIVRDRKEFVRLFSKNFDLGLWFTSVTQGRNTNLDEIGYRAGSCPNAEFAATHVVNLPTHQRVPSELLLPQVDRVLPWLKDNLVFERDAP